MSDVQTADSGEDTTPAATVIALDADAPESFDSAERAVASLVAARQKAGIPAEGADDATAEDELSDEDNAAPEKATGEDEEADPAARPSLELPRSWTKDRAEHWAKLDPGTQEFLLEQDRKASEAVRRSQNELADERNAVKAQREAAEKVRQQYEAQLPALMRELESAHQQSFSDIRTMDDVAKLQADDPFRFQVWQVQQMRLQTTKFETDRVAAQTLQEKQGKRVSYEAEQNKLLVDLVPEMADPKKSVELRDRAVTMLTDDLGMKRDQLERWMQDDTGHEILSNAGFQKLVADGLKYRDILSAPKAVVKSDLPPVQRPGVARAHGSDRAALVQSLTDKLSNSGSEKDALELLLAKRASRRAS